MIIKPDIVVKIAVSNPINKVVAFNNIENNIIDTLRANIIIYGLYFSEGFSTELPKIIGNRGNTHGASTVSTHAKKETNKIVIMVILNNNYLIKNLEE